MVTRKYFEEDKAANLSASDRRALDRLVSTFVIRRHLYVFALPIENERESTIQRLVDGRVVHIISRQTFDEKNPVERYTVFAIDYGAYVHLMGTVNQPELGFRMGDLTVGRQMKKFVVPNDLISQ